jgi:hypothetical protein
VIFVISSAHFIKKQKQRPESPTQILCILLFGWFCVHTAQSITIHYRQIHYIHKTVSMSFLEG